MPSLADQVVQALRRQGHDLSDEHAGELRGLVDASQAATLSRALDALTDAVQAADEADVQRDAELLSVAQAIQAALADQDRAALSSSLQAMQATLDRQTAAQAATSEQEGAARQRALDLLERVLPPLIAAAAGAAGVSYMVQP